MQRSNEWGHPNFANGNSQYQVELKTAALTRSKSELTTKEQEKDLTMEQ